MNKFEQVSSDGHQMSVARGLTRVVPGLMLRGAWGIPEHRTQDTPPPPPALTLTDGHHNTYSWQAGGTHPIEMLSCY